VGLGLGLELPFFKSGRKGKNKRITTCSGVSSSSSQEGRKEERRTSSLPPSLLQFESRLQHFHTEI